MLKITISTSVWSAQHPNAGRNKQQRSSSLFQILMKLQPIVFIKEDFSTKSGYCRQIIMPLGAVHKLRNEKRGSVVGPNVI